MGAWIEISSRGKTLLYLYEQNMKIKNYLKVFEEVMKKGKNLEIFL